MIVCPQCRHGNEEDAQFCSQCGRTLEPGPSSLAPVRRDVRAVEEEDLLPVVPRKRWPAFAVMGGLLLGGLIAWMVVALRPDPCDGRDFVSERFGYCLSVPEGWEAGAAQIGVLAADRISLPQESATVLIHAVDLPDGTVLEEYVDELRRRQEMQGIDPGPIRDDSLDGAPARSWDAVVDAQGRALVARYVVTLRGDIGWQIALSDSQERLVFHESAFRSMLSSWKFR